MLADVIFYLNYVLTAPAWLLLIFAPDKPITKKLVNSGLVTLILGLCYILLLFRNIPYEGGYFSVEEATKIFFNRELLVLCWSHILAFDLIIGSWYVADSKRVGIPHRYVVPCLVLAYAFGPTGFVLYYLIRFFYRKNANLGFWE